MDTVDKWPHFYFWNKWLAKGNAKCAQLDFTNREPKGNAMRLFRMVIENKIDPYVIILGQDPYPQPGIATGIAFANNHEPYSPSLQVIENSICRIYGPTKDGFDYTLESWVKQGILPFNTAFTVQTNKPGSDSLLWAGFTAEFLRELDKEYPNRAYIFFGQSAQVFAKCVEGNKLSELHPSYYARNNQHMTARVWIEAAEWIKTLFNVTLKWRKDHEQ